MAIGNTVRTRLLSKAAVTAIVGADPSRLYPDRLPPKWKPADGDALTYQGVGGSRLYDLRGAAGVARARIRFQCWSATRLGAWALAAAVRAAFDDWHLESGAPVRSVFQEGLDEDDFDPDAPGDSGAYRTILDFTFRFNE